MANDSDISLRLTAGPLGEADCVVLRVRGVEELSTPYRFEVDFAPAAGVEVKPADLLGTEGHLAIQRGKKGERFVHGIVWRVGVQAVHEKRPRYRLVLVPSLARLGLVRGSRVFQKLSVPDIAKKLLDEAEIAYEVKLSGSHPAREYCLQYREPNLAFLSRLLEDAGISYRFEHAADAHTLVLFDAAASCPAIPGDATVPTRPVGQDAYQQEHLTRLHPHERLRTGKVELRDYDFARPALALQGKQEAQGADATLEAYEYPVSVPGGAPAAHARLRLESLRAPTSTLSGEGNCTRFVAGATFEAAENAEAGLDGKLVLLRLELQAEQQGAGRQQGGPDYQNRFVALRADAPLRPARRTPRPRAISETAWVVGPSGEEIHADEHGRVKVQFHWDRDGKRDDAACCWVRCAQRWAGAGAGALYLPRVGQEVVVRFLEGDPDRPLVTGAVYNGQSPPPLQLPDEKSRSTLRSDSSKGGGGSNELRLEDLKDREEIYLHAEKDLAIEVENDKTQQVRAAQSLAVAKDRSLQVQGRQDLTVAGSDSSSAGGNQTLTVAGSRATLTGGGHAETVVGPQAETVAGNQAVTVGLAPAETVGAAAATTIGGAYAVTVGGVVNEAVGGLLSRQVGGARVEVVGLVRTERVAKDFEARVGGDFEAEVAGGLSRSTTQDHDETVDGAVEIEAKELAEWTAKDVTLEADEFKLIVGGKVAIAIDKSGNVTFGASNLTVEGQGEIKLKGSKLKKEAAGSASSGSAPVTKLSPLPGEKSYVEISLQDQDGLPLPNEWFQVEFPDGTVKEGRTDRNGFARVPGPKEGSVKVTFPKMAQKALSNR